MMVFFTYRRRPWWWLLGLMLLAGSGQAAIPPGLQGTLIVLNKNGHNASFIDLATGDLLTTLPTGQGPHELIVTGDGRWAIGTDYAGGNSLTVFDVAALTVARTIDLGAFPRPHGILLMPGEQQLLVTSEASQQLVLVDFHRGDIVRAVATGQPGSHMVAMSADGSVAFTSNGGGDSISRISLQQDALPAILPVPRRPEAIATNRAGSLVWVGSNEEQVVSTVDARSGEIVRQWSGFGWPYRILLDPAESLAVIPDLRLERLRFFQLDNGAETGVMDFAGAGPQGVVLHPDGKTLFLSLSAQDKVAVIDLASRQLLGEYAAGDGPDGIGFSPLVLSRSE